MRIHWDDSGSYAAAVYAVQLGAVRRIDPKVSSDTIPEFLDQPTHLQRTSQLCPPHVHLTRRLGLRPIPIAEQCHQPLVPRNLRRITPPLLHSFNQCKRIFVLPRLLRLHHRRNPHQPVMQHPFHAHLPCNPCTSSRRINDKVRLTICSRAISNRLDMKTPTSNRLLCRRHPAVRPDETSRVSDSLPQHL